MGRVCDRRPCAGGGEIVRATETWEEPAGGGAVAAVQLAKLNGSCLFLTAVSDDPLGSQVKPELERRARGLRRRSGNASSVAPSFISIPGGERTITTTGNGRPGRATICLGSPRRLRRGVRDRRRPTPRLPFEPGRQKIVVATIRAARGLLEHPGSRSTSWSRAERPR